MKKEWYKVLGSKGHYKDGKATDITFYIEAEDIVNALEKYKNLPGIKGFYRPGTMKGKQYYNPTPNISLVVNKEERAHIEKKKRENPLIWFCFKDE